MAKRTAASSGFAGDGNSLDGIDKRTRLPLSFRQRKPCPMDVCSVPSAYRLAIANFAVSERSFHLFVSYSFISVHLITGDGNQIGFAKVCFPGDRRYIFCDVIRIYIFIIGSHIFGYDSELHGQLERIREMM